VGLLQRLAVQVLLLEVLPQVEQLPQPLLVVLRQQVELQQEQRQELREQLEQGRRVPELPGLVQVLAREQEGLPGQELGPGLGLEVVLELVLVALLPLAVLWLGVKELGRRPRRQLRLWLLRLRLKRLLGFK
jgi:hypothetical protein